jgi:hypothetical protein
MIRSVVVGFRDILNYNWWCGVVDEGGRKEKDEQDYFDIEFTLICHVLSIILISLQFSRKTRGYTDVGNRILKKK